MEPNKNRKVVGLAFTLWLFAFTISSAQELTGTEILDRVEKLLWGRTSQGLSEMTIITPRWQRTLLMRIWMDRPDKTFVRILSPAKEAGIGSLRIKTEMWNYLPNIERVIKIPPSMMLQPWMGSDFTNDDLVKESSIVNDYTHAIIGFEEMEGTQVYKIEAIPKQDAPVVWGKLIYWVRKKDLIPLKQDFYNERGEIIKVMVFTEIRPMGGRIIPTRWEMRSMKKEGNVTIVVLKEMVFDKTINQEIFTLRNLQKIE